MKNKGCANNSHEHEYHNAQLDAFPRPVVFFYLTAGKFDFVGNPCGMRYGGRGVCISNGREIREDWHQIRPHGCFYNVGEAIIVFSDIQPTSGKVLA